MMRELRIDKTGVFIDGQEIDMVERVDILNINADGTTEIAIYTRVQKLDIQYQSPYTLRDKREDIGKEPDKINNEANIIFEF